MSLELRTSVRGNWLGKRKRGIGMCEGDQEEKEEGQWGFTVPLLPVTAELRCLESKGPVVSGRMGAGEVVDGDDVVGHLLYVTNNNDNKHVNKKGQSKYKTIMTMGRKHSNDNGTNETQ